MYDDEIESVRTQLADFVISTLVGDVATHDVEGVGHGDTVRAPVDHHAELGLYAT